MKQIFKLAHLSNDTIRMVGKHGIGKSQIVEEFAKENNFHIETLFLSQNEVADLIGIPYQEKQTTFWSKPSWLKRMEEANASGKHCILFLDEFSRAPIEVRQSALQLVLEGRIHEHQLPILEDKKTLIIAADNPTDDYDVYELDPALLDRFGNYNIEISVEDWLQWARKNNVVSVITDYIAEFPEKLHFIPEDDTDKGATPRSWAKLSGLVANFNEIDEGLRYPVIVSKLGSTVGSSFFHYFNNYIKVVKPEDIAKKLQKMPLKTEEDYKKAAKKVSKDLNKMEALALQELANKIKDLSEKNEKWMKILTVVLEAINVEIMVSIIKGWKESEEDSEFYFKWAETVPNGFIFVKVLRIKENKENKGEE
jgi:hypothetical protein